MPSGQSVRFLAIGQLRNEFIIDFMGRAFNDLIGGSALYAAGMMSYREENVGVLGVIGNNFPKSWKTEFENNHINFHGIHQLQESVDLRAFYSYFPKPRGKNDNPVALYAERGLTFPRQLLGYHHDDFEPQLEKQHQISRIMLEHIPPGYLEATAAHLCPLDLATQIQLTTLLFKGSIRTITLQPHFSYMLPEHWDDIRIVVKDTTAFITSEKDLISLFQGRSVDTWEMMETVSLYGCKFIIVRNNDKGWKFFDSTNSTKYVIQDYPSSIIDPTGFMDAYAAGFLTHFKRSYDPLRAAIMGCVAVSIKVQGTGPFAVKTCLPGLDEARFGVLQDMIVRV